MAGLFGEEFEVSEIKTKAKVSVKDLLNRTNGQQADKSDIDKILKSKSVSLEEKLLIINERVLAILGRQRENVVVIKTKEQLYDYVTAAIESGRIAIDTETNNSLDPVTCKLMGLCLYYPGGKQAYIPVNHRDYKTKERLAWQLTEADIAEALNRIVASKVEIVMHNGKFDYEVLYCTCGVKVVPHWDTIIAHRLIDENEKAGLKEIYTKKINKAQAKYDIDNLFKGVAYADVDPDIFALYAATDSMMTDEVFLIQKPIMEAPEQSKLLWLFYNIEMPIVIVTAEMEMRGVYIDEAFGQRLKDKYTNKLNSLDKSLEATLKILNPLIEIWKLTPSANAVTRVYEPKKSKKSAEKLAIEYPYVDDDLGKRYKLGKARVEQLDDPISLSSATQLGVLFYDIFRCPAVSKKSPRGTGANELKELSKLLKSEKEQKKMIESAIEIFTEKAAQIQSEEDVEEDTSKKEKAEVVKTDEELFNEALDDLLAEDEEAIEVETVEAVEEVVAQQEVTPEYVTMLYKSILPIASTLCDTILERRGLTKLISTYIDVIPELVKHWPDHRIRFHLNSLGTDTGRYSSGGKLKFMENDEAITVSGINIQNIPSHNKEIRMLFGAKPGYKLVGSDYSAQEPRLTTFISQDPNMLNAYLNKQDLYAVIAQSAFDNDYKDNLEFWPEGTELEIDGNIVIAGNKTHKNPGGKDRRSVGKVLLLASTYGMSGSTAGQRLNKSADEGQELLDKFFGMFPHVKQAIDDSKKMLEQKGYVEDWAGRRRHLPDIRLKPYVVEYLDKAKNNQFNPIPGCKPRTQKDAKIVSWEKKVQEQIAKSQEFQKKKAAEKGKPYTPTGEMSNKAYEKLAKEARKDGVNIIANTGRIAQASRQCFNARIQGGAASLTKYAMVKIHNDPQMNAWDAHLVITVHDEVLVECPEQYADLVEKRLPELMISAAADVGINVPMSCDPYNVKHWYADEAAASIQDEFKKLMNSDNPLSRDDAIKAVIRKHPEHSAQTIEDVITGKTEQLEF